MVTWTAFAEAAPEMAEAGRRLFYQVGVGLGFLATLRPGGGPRLHPICPIVSEAGLHAFIQPSPKRDDLIRRGQYALHAFPHEATDDEFAVLGRAVLVEDAAVGATVIAAFHRTADQEAEATLFEFRIERALLIAYRRRGDPQPDRRWWHAPR